MQIVSVRRALLKWFDVSGREFPWREEDANEYLKILTEVLLQRTRAESVAKFVGDFVDRYPSWSELSKARERDIGVRLRPIGLWRRRARSLRGLAQAVVANRGIWSRDRAELERVPGVGQYVASAVLLFVHNRQEPLLDTNMARVLERVFGARVLVDIRDDPWLQELSRRLVRSKRAIDVNWAVLDLAALICTPRSPRCPECPLAPYCRYYQVVVKSQGKNQTVRRGSRPLSRLDE
jgi:A/G-specific adenine glycosylase